MVREANEGIYLELVEAAGKDDLLVQVFTDSIGHCNFSAEQLLATVAAMDYWLDTGIKPPAALFFLVALDFIPSFVPPPWPFVY